MDSQNKKIVCTPPTHMKDIYTAGEGSFAIDKNKVIKEYNGYCCQKCKRTSDKPVPLGQYTIYLFAIFILCFIKKYLYIQCPECGEYRLLSGKNRKRVLRGEDFVKVWNEEEERKENKRIEFVNERVGKRSPKSRKVTAWLMILWPYGIECLYLGAWKQLAIRLAVVIVWLFFMTAVFPLGMIIWFVIFGMWIKAYVDLFTMKRKDGKGRYIMTEIQAYNIEAEAKMYEKMKAPKTK